MGKKKPLSEQVHRAYKKLDAAIDALWEADEILKGARRITGRSGADRGTINELQETAAALRTLLAVVAGGTFRTAVHLDKCEKARGGK